MGSVTALMMDVITEKSGHSMTGLAVSVCLTPAAPSPLPIPYPTVASVAEGVMDECLRTKIDGAKVLTVGSCTKNCHGNEPGTLKEVVSLNTAGPCFPILGAPIVFIELGMAGITLSPGFMNKNPIPGIGGSASGAGGGGGGGGGAGGGAGGPPGGNTHGPSNGGGGGGGSNSGAAPPNAPAPPTAEGQANAGHPVDVITGAMFTDPVDDFVSPGPLPFSWSRSYRSSSVRRNAGMGWGWSHPFAWSVLLDDHGCSLIDEHGITVRLEPLRDDARLSLPFGRTIERSGDEIFVDAGDGARRVFRRSAAKRFDMVEIRNRASASVYVERDEAGEITALVDSVGRRAERTTEGGLVVWTLRAVDPLGASFEKRLVAYEIDGRGDLTRVIDAGGVETRYTYDDDHYLLSEELPDGLIWHFRYEEALGQIRCVETWGQLKDGDVLSALGRIPTESRPRGVHHVTLAYGPGPFESTVRDAEGHVHGYWGNALGLVTRYVDPAGYSVVMSYDPRGLMTSRMDGAGRRIQKSYDAAGRLVRLVDALGRPTTLERNEQGDVTTLVDAAGRRWGAKYDGRGLPIERTDPSGMVTTITYDDVGLPVCVTGPSGAAETMEYDAHGNLIRYTTATGATWRYQFDQLGLVTRATRPTGGNYQFFYDSRGDLVRMEDPAGRRMEHEIDAARRVVRTRHPGGGLSTYRHVAGALVERRYPDGTWIRAGYDARLLQTWIENAAGERHLLDHDGCGRLRAETSFSGVTRAYEHDGSGQVVAEIGPRGERTVAHRDAIGRMLARELPSGKTVRFRYDDADQMLSATDGLSTVTFERDGAGRVLRETQRCGGFELIVEHAYDESGWISKRSYSTGWSARYERGPGGRARKIEIGQDGGAVEETLLFEHDTAGEETFRAFEGGGSVSTIRDIVGRPTRIEVRARDGAVRRERELTYAPQGPVARVTDVAGGARSYELDPVGRPLRTVGLGADEAFRYSAHGTPIPSTEPRTIGQGGRIIESSTAALLWDEQGRLAARHDPDKRRAWIYRYDEDGQLAQAERGDGFTVRYLYDPFGRRVAETAEGVTTWFGWDGDSCVEERRTDGHVTRRLFADDGFTPVLEGSGEGFWLFAVDAASTPWFRMDRAGAEGELDLTTWGRAARAEQWDSLLRFAGQRADLWTGLSYNRNRYYVPDLGIFMTPDPLGLDGSLFDLAFSLNATIYIDPLGLIILLATDDPQMAQAARVRGRATGQDVISYRDLGPNSLAGHDHLELVTHGSPGSAEWGSGNMINGRQMANRVMNAGFRGNTVHMTVCNAATTPTGRGNSFAQQFANQTRSNVHAMEGAMVATSLANGAQWPSDRAGRPVRTGGWVDLRPNRPRR